MINAVGHYYSNSWNGSGSKHTFANALGGNSAVYTGVLRFWDCYGCATAMGTGVADKRYGLHTGTAMGVADERYGCSMVPSTTVRTCVER